MLVIEILMSIAALMKLGVSYMTLIILRMEA